MSSIDPDSSSIYVTKLTTIDAYQGRKAKCLTTLSEIKPKISIRMRAQTNIKRIVLIPPVGGGPAGPSTDPVFNQQLAVYLDNYDGTSHLCGSSTSIFTSFEFDCGSA